MEKKIILDKDIKVAVRELGKVGVFGIKSKKIDYQLQISCGVLVIVASNSKGKIEITPDSVDTVKKEIRIQGQVYKYKEA